MREARCDRQTTLETLKATPDQSSDRRNPAPVYITSWLNCCRGTQTTCHPTPSCVCALCALSATHVLEPTATWPRGDAQSRDWKQQIAPKASGRPAQLGHRALTSTLGNQGEHPEHVCPERRRCWAHLPSAESPTGPKRTYCGTMSCLARCQDRCQGRGHWRHWTRDRPSYMFPSHTLMPRLPPEPGPKSGPKRAPVAKSDWRPPLPAARVGIAAETRPWSLACWTMVGSMGIQCGPNAK